MTGTPSFYIRTDQYRALIDNQGNGQIRIVRRTNLRTLIHVFRDLYLALVAEGRERPAITLYLSRSLCDESSEGFEAFLGFCRDCLGVEVALVVVE